MQSTKWGMWILAVVGLGWCLASQTNVTQRDYVYNAGEMAQNGAWVPLIWSYSLMWIIFACYTGNGSKPMVPMAPTSPVETN